MEKKILILGSCVTRDAFELCSNSNKPIYKIANYFARTSLISLTSAPLLIKESEIQLSSAFQRRIIYNDFQKTFFTYLSKINSQNTFLIIDFIDERFDLLKSNESIITKSVELNQSNVISQYNFTQLHRQSDITDKLWQKSCLLFIERICNFFPAKNIILHKAFWSNYYIDNDITTEFDDQHIISTHNQSLNSYYSFFKQKLPKCNEIYVTQSNLADKNHKWGLSPFHYQQEYYSIFLDQLDQLTT